MTPEEFSKALEHKAAQVKSYANNTFPSMAGNILVRFVNGNFRAQGYQGNGFQKWKPSNGGKGTTLVKSGAMRAATYYTTQPGQVTLRNNTPQARAHNEGFKGTVNVKAHTRNKYGKMKVGTGKLTKTGKERMATKTFKSGEGSVKAHTRKMDLPKRQFMPITGSDSPTLTNAIERQTARDLHQIIK